MKRPVSARVRRSVALPRELVEDAAKVAPGELRENLNRLVVARREAAVFEDAMARMAVDPGIRSECTQIDAEIRTSFARRLA